MPTSRWLICGLLFLVTICSYVSRQVFSLIAPVIAAESHFTNTDIATIINAFIVAYTFGQLFAGAFVDAIGARRAFTFAAIVWSLANILASLGHTIWYFSSFRFLLGGAESVNFPGGVKVIAEWFPAKERSTAIGFFSSGASIGAIIAPPAIVYLVLHFGWRWASVVIGSMSLAWVALWLRFYRPATCERPKVREETRPYSDGPTETSPGAWSVILRKRSVWAVLFSRFLEEPVSWFYFTWLPVYLKSARQVSFSDIGRLLIIPFVTLDLGYIVGGWTASSLLRSGYGLTQVRKLIMTASALCMLASIPAIYSHTALQFTLFVSVATFGHGSWGANIFAYPADLVAASSVGRAYGLTALGGGIGSIVFIQLVGRLVDTYHSFKVIFFLLGALPIAAALVLFVLVSAEDEYQAAPSTLLLAAEA